MCPYAIHANVVTKVVDIMTNLGTPPTLSRGFFQLYSWNFDTCSGSLLFVRCPVLTSAARTYTSLQSLDKLNTGIARTEVMYCLFHPGNVPVAKQDGSDPPSDAHAL